MSNSGCQRIKIGISFFWSIGIFLLLTFTLNDFMKRFLYLIFVFLFLGGKSFSLPVTTADSLRQIIRQLPAKEKETALIDAAFKFVRENPAAAMDFALHFEELPGEEVSVKTKVDFFKSLSGKFELTGDYRHALVSYKIADSLQIVYREQMQERLSEKSALPFTFYLFLFVLLAGAAWLVTVFLSSRKMAHSLKKAEKRGSVC